MKRFDILIGRLHKMENLICKLVNLLDGQVFGGELPAQIKEGIKTDKFRNHLKDKIAKAERIKLDIAIAIYDDICQ
jgi:hypothetical protein